MIRRSVLVLNKSWVAIATTTARRALSLVFREHACIIDPQTYEIFAWERWVNLRSRSNNGTHAVNEEVIATPQLLIELPGVIALSGFNGVPNRSIPFSRRALYRRDNHQCQYCAATPGLRQLTIDHVMPRSRGGGTDWHNCVVACTRCNVRKSNRTPHEANMPLLRDPYRPDFVEALHVEGDIPERWKNFVRERR